MASSSKIVYTTATLADELGAPDAKALRVFLRSKASGIMPVGKGARYSLEFGARDLAGLKKRYAEWGAAQAERKAEAAQAATPAAPAAEAAPAASARPAPKASRKKAAKVDLAAIVEAELAESGADEIGQRAADEELDMDGEPSEADMELIEDELDEL